MTLPEIAIMIEDDRKTPMRMPFEMSDEEYAKYWASLTPKERLLKVANSKRHP